MVSARPSLAPLARSRALSTQVQGSAHRLDPRAPLSSLAELRASGSAGTSSLNIQQSCPVSYVRVAENRAHARWPGQEPRPKVTATASYLVCVRARAVQDPLALAPTWRVVSPPPPLAQSQLSVLPAALLNKIPER